MRIHGGVSEVIGSQQVAAKRCIVFAWRKNQRSAIAPPSHELGGYQLLFFTRLALLPEKIAEGAHMLLHPHVSQIAAIAGERFRPWDLRLRARLIDVAEKEFTGFDGRP